MDVGKKLSAALDESNRVAWTDTPFRWERAYVSALFSDLAYCYIPKFEANDAYGRAKIVPSKAYRVIVSSRQAAEARQQFQTTEREAQITVVERDLVVVVIVRTPRVVHVVLRGTTMCYADLLADLDFRKAKYPITLTLNGRMHRGFLDAVASCYHEVVSTLTDVAPDCPICICGHSLGGAMAAILNARLGGWLGQVSFWRPRGWHADGRRHCYAFGAPRFGDHYTIRYLESPHLIRNIEDGVPSVPPTWLGFAGHGHDHCLSAAGEAATRVGPGNTFVKWEGSRPRFLGIAGHRMGIYLNRVRRMAMRERLASRRRGLYLS